MSRSLLRSTLVVWPFLGLPATTGHAAFNQYFESFTTTTYKDAVNTTALWDTGTGQLKLALFDPSPVGIVDTPGPAVGVAIAGDLAFIADGASGLQIIDITNPASPSLIGTYNTPSSAAAVAVAGDLAFVADGSSGLQIISISNPTSPSLVGTYNTPGSASAVAVAGDLAFIADGASGLQVVSIINPAIPSLVGTYNTPGSATGVAVAGDLAFVADGTSGLQIIDITNPASPSLVGTYDTPGGANGVSVAGDLAFVGDGLNGIQIVDITVPASPSLVGTYDTPGFAYKAALAGDLAVVADGAFGIQILDITNPASPVIVDTYDTTGFTYHVAISGNLVFLADGANGLQVFEMMTPALPSLVGTYDTPGFAFRPVASGDLILLADDAGGLQIIDITNPASPSPTGAYDTPGFAHDIAVAGDLVFVADRSSGLTIINITNPASPTLTGTYNTPGDAYGVAVDGDLAFVADYDAGLQIINITNPASPILTGTYNTPGFAFAVAVDGDLVLVADGNSGLLVIDITNPASPSLVGTYDTAVIALGVAVAGDLAFVADGSSGLQIIDITDPTSPTLAGTYDTPAVARGVAVAGDLVLVADGTGLLVIDITNPASPTLAAAYDTPGDARGVSVHGALAVVADNNTGLSMVRVFHREFYTLNNVGRSLPVDGPATAIMRVRLTSTQTAGVTWTVGGAAVAPDNTWSILSPVDDLLWGSTHVEPVPGQNPTVFDLQIEWRSEHAIVNAVTDIPGDQGGWVQLSMTRSGRDFTDDPPLPIANYGVWRRVESSAALAALASARGDEKIDASISEGLGALPVFGYGNQVFMQSVPGPVAAGFPPGTWALVTTIPAVQQDTYLAVIPTAADSTVEGMQYTALVVTAHTTTPTIWYTSPPDSGYSVDNIAPAVPASFAIAYNTGNGNTLSWGSSPDDDFQYFRVYRSTDPNFTISPGTLVHATTTTGWADPDNDGGLIYYKVTALDYAGNESDPAVAGSVTAVEIPAMPRSFALYPNVPNPFNPTTLIRYDVPERGGVVSLRVYNVDGSLVKTLVEGAQSAGQKAVSWDGRDDAGRPVASGVYFYRLTASDYTKTHKMILLK